MLIYRYNKRKERYNNIAKTRILHKLIKPLSNIDACDLPELKDFIFDDYSYYRIRNLYSLCLSINCKWEHYHVKSCDFMHFIILPMSQVVRRLYIYKITGLQDYYLNQEANVLCFRKGLNGYSIADAYNFLVMKKFTPLKVLNYSYKKR